MNRDWINYYHIAEYQLAKSMLEKGIKSSQGDLRAGENEDHIFLLGLPVTWNKRAILSFCNYVARGQLLLTDTDFFIIIKIDPECFHVKPLKDGPGEFTSAFQYILPQESIIKERLSHYSTIKVNTKKARRLSERISQALNEEAIETKSITFDDLEFLEKITERKVERCDLNMSDYIGLIVKDIFENM